MSSNSLFIDKKHFKLHLCFSTAVCTFLWVNESASVLGAGRFCDNIEDMIGYKPLPLFKYCWLYVTPLICLVSFCNNLSYLYKRSFTLIHPYILFILCFHFKGTLVFLLLRYTPMKFNNTYVYPWWAYCIGWFLAMSSLFMIPLHMICKLVKGKGTFWQVSVWFVIFYSWMKGLMLWTSSEPYFLWLSCHYCCTIQSLTVQTFSPASQDEHSGCRWPSGDGKGNGKHECTTACP